MSTGGGRRRARWVLSSLASCALGLIGCGQEVANRSTETPSEQAASGSPNVLLLLLDDVGVDRVGVYGQHPATTSTPNIDALAARGVLFRQAWATPLCTPTRAAIQTGRYGFRTGVGTVGSGGLPLDEVTLAEMLKLSSEASYATAAIGKWHLGGTLNGGPKSANQAGYDHFSGTLGNLSDYFKFKKVTDGEAREVKSYATSDQTTDALTWIRKAPEPWFCYVAYNAAHRPLHNPPPRLIRSDAASRARLDPGRAAFESMVEALDTEIGRLLGGLSDDLLERTNIILLSDNGTHRAQTAEPGKASAGKGSVHESGILVPFVIAGPGVRVPGREVGALIDVTDIFATVAEWAGVERTQLEPELAGSLDSISLVPYLANPEQTPLRRTIFAECFRPNGFGPYSLVRRAVRDERYKLVYLERDGGQPVRHLYDLGSDPAEERDLLKLDSDSPETTRAFERLNGELEGLLSSE